ncbi:DUF4148 domain-containing protein [Variovorax sp. VNK109]|uniref:DUF4148 domain-containing protein n=1 Tax=Variovorax sp. VNK109 TaxID=3400919 RepID=UPI003C029B22
MNRNIATLAIALAAGFGAVGAHADEADGSQFAVQANSVKSRAEVQAELAQFQKGANPWSIRYNQLAAFKSTRDAADVRAEAIAARNETTALNGEDSGSAYLAANAGHVVTSTTLAGTPSQSAY